jgi:hypothetical protein
MSQEVSWGLVVSAAPLKVRFVGDSADTAVGWIAGGLTVAASDKVLLAKTGSADGWAVIAKLVAS